MGIILNGIIENVSTRKDRSLKITIGTQELGSKHTSELFELSNNIANIYISANQISNEIKSEIDKHSKDEVDKIKSPSQRLRAVLFLNYKENNSGFNTFENYYASKMEQIINHYKGKLDEK
jgi:hypothetical protein